MEIKSKIGVGIITYKREKMFNETLDTIPRDKVHHIVAVNDSPDVKYNFEDKDVQYIENKVNQGVGISKNIALTKLINAGCTHLFIIEDDILIKDPDVFEYFIKCAAESGIWHLNYGHTGSKQIIHRKKYDEQELIFYPDPQGGFQYFHITLINKFKGFDPVYKNAFEHADYTYVLTKAGLMPPFWCFPCPAEPENYIEINGDYEESTITDKPMYKENYSTSAQHWVQKHGSFVSAIPRPTINDVEISLKKIKEMYSVGK